MLTGRAFITSGNSSSTSGSDLLLVSNLLKRAIYGRETLMEPSDFNLDPIVPQYNQMDAYVVILYGCHAAFAAYTASDSAHAHQSHDYLHNALDHKCDRSEDLLSDLICKSSFEAARTELFSNGPELAGKSYLISWLDRLNKNTRDRQYIKSYTDYLTATLPRRVAFGALSTNTSSRIIEEIVESRSIGTVTSFNSILPNSIQYSNSVSSGLGLARISSSKRLFALRSFATHKPCQNTWSNNLEEQLGKPIIPFCSNDPILSVCLACQTDAICPGIIIIPANTIGSLSTYFLSALQSAEKHIATNSTSFSARILSTATRQLLRNHSPFTAHRHSVVVKNYTAIENGTEDKTKNEKDFVAKKIALFQVLGGITALKADAPSKKILRCIGGRAQNNKYLTIANPNFQSKSAYLDHYANFVRVSTEFSAHTDDHRFECESFSIADIAKRLPRPSKDRDLNKKKCMKRIVSIN